MPQPFDATTKDLVEMHPEDWLAYLGLPRAAVEVVDADVSTVSAAADKVLRVLEPDPWLRKPHQARRGGSGQRRTC